MLLRRTKRIERMIDDFLDVVSEGGILFSKAIRFYVEENTEEFDARRLKVSELESTADQLRRDIEMELYAHTLIPESRGDVLAILENTDDIIDNIKETLLQFSVEHPKIPHEFASQYIELAIASGESVDALVTGVRCFFRDVKTVKDHLHKVYLHEKEADKIAERLKRAIFNSDIELAWKNHLRYFALHVEHVSDYAETMADRLSIYTIKRQV